MPHGVSQEADLWFAVCYKDLGCIREGMPCSAPSEGCTTVSVCEGTVAPTCCVCVSYCGDHRVGVGGGGFDLLSDSHSWALGSHKLGTLLSLIRWGGQGEVGWDWGCFQGCFRQRQCLVYFAGSMLFYLGVACRMRRFKSCMLPGHLCAVIIMALV